MDKEPRRLVALAQLEDCKTCKYAKRIGIDSKGNSIFICYARLNVQFRLATNQIFNIECHIPNKEIPD